MERDTTKKGQADTQGRKKDREEPKRPYEKPALTTFGPVEEHTGPGAS